MLSRSSISTILSLWTLAVSVWSSSTPGDVPGQACWPSKQKWDAFNETVNGRLIANTPVAISCYDGPEQNKSECAVVTKNYANNTFQQQYPIGYSYPIGLDCPLVTFDQAPESQCMLGSAPVYTVIATSVEEVQATILWARSKNIRLVIRDTGHDLLGRSMGYGSLQIWIKYLRQGIEYHQSFKQPGGAWTGSAFSIRGGYTWSDVYVEATKHQLIVVGGGTPSVGCVGGWMQGGGHGPATHDFGLGADNVLQAKVVLADGCVVTASPVENKDLFFAIRGGGPGTYGVVVETVVKAFPTQKVLAQTMAFAPLAGNNTSFLSSVADLYEAFPKLARAGWSGYGQWTTSAAVPFVGNFTTAYAHTFANFKNSPKDAKALFASTIAKLSAKNGSELFVAVSYTETPDYAKFYAQFSGVEPPAGSLGTTTGRFLDENALLGDREKLLKTLETLAGTPDQYTTNVVEMFGAPYGQIAVDGRKHSVSGLNPAWRNMIVHHIVARNWKQNTTAATVKQIQNDVLFVKEGALKKLAPNTGGYMNENSRLDPDWQQDFYGSHFERLSRIKKEYDPEGVFYCPTCVGSEKWVVKDDGQLCSVSE